MKFWFRVRYIELEHTGRVVCPGWCFGCGNRSLYLVFKEKLSQPLAKAAVKSGDFPELWVPFQRVQKIALEEVGL